MGILYNLTVYAGQLLIWIISPFNSRIRKWYYGRKGLFKKVSEDIDVGKKHVWFHFASLGEFEQGRTVLEGFKAKYPEKPVVVTFFSPSGYEIKKNYTQAEHVYYLPIDTKANARKFVSLINPEMAFFVKYEFWYNFYAELAARHIPIYLVSAIFRTDQVFFRWYGGLFRKTLRLVSRFFLQNQESAALLDSIGIHNYELTGDTRFDRVFNLSKHNRNIDVIKQFIGTSKVLVAGSTYMQDEEYLMSLKRIYPEWKFIIAPHIISKSHIEEIGDRFSNSVLYSVLNAYVRPTEKLPNLTYDPRHEEELSTLVEEDEKRNSDSVFEKKALGKQLAEKQPDVLVIDNVGMLSYLYAYGDVAYLGGGFGEGIHNTLEAATYGIPILFGPNYEKFQEAKDLISMKAAFCVNNLNELVTCFEYLQDAKERREAGDRAHGYVEQQAGATEKILTYLSQQAV